MGAEGGEAKTDEDGLVDVEFVERCLREDLEKIFGSTILSVPFPAFSWGLWQLNAEFACVMTAIVMRSGWRRLALAADFASRLHWTRDGGRERKWNDFCKKQSSKPGLDPGS
jgi:hypothetical protein